MNVTPSGFSASVTALTTAGEAAIVPASPTPLTPSRLTGDGRLGAVGLERRDLGRGGQRVVDERAGDQLAVLVVDDLLVQRLADAVGHAAVHLAVDQHRVDGRAAVVDRHPALDLDLAGLHVHVDHARVRAEREHEVLRVVERGLLEARLDVGRQLVRRDVRSAGDLGHRHRLVGRAAHLELAVGQLDVLGRGLQQRGADLLGLVLHLLGGAAHRLAAHGERTRAVRAPAERALVRVAVQDVDVLGVDPEAVGDDLREAGVVALAVRERCRCRRWPSRWGARAPSPTPRTPPAGRRPAGRPRATAPGRTPRRRWRGRCRGRRPCRAARACSRRNASMSTCSSSLSSVPW